MKILLLSVLAVAMIGLMIPNAYANEYSDAPDHIRELLERKDCLNESEFNTWKDGKEYHSMKKENFKMITTTFINKEVIS